MDNHNFKEVTSALPASRVETGISYREGIEGEGVRCWRRKWAAETLTHWTNTIVEAATSGLYSGRVAGRAGSFFAVAKLAKLQLYHENRIIYVFLRKNTQHFYTQTL
ncbi:hypothetical protein EVAR_64490_1 [Eumeta japonica]|uniref:Uncharacterized protein n=1 Tax=Eumeta variegata TaxID=151549 RepID=A0A4C2A7S9_EUMVA|nr:hypothetical protein EVAR_64490_1 [Eumeta japonica]